MELKQLQAFVSVVNHQSFTAAAEELNLSQPSVSTYVRRLEEELDESLLTRSTKTLRLTPAGEAVYRYAQQMLTLNSQLLENCSSGRKKRIRVGASSIPSAYLLPELLNVFRKEDPEVLFEIRKGDSAGILEQLSAGYFDLAVVGMSDARPELELTELTGDHLVLITPAGEPYRSLAAAPDAAARLLDFPFILREEGSGSLHAAEAFFRKAGKELSAVHTVVRTDDQESIKAMVEAGIGISVISDLAVRQETADGRLLKFELSPELRHFYLARRRDALMPAHVQAFYRCILDTCRG